MLQTNLDKLLFVVTYHVVSFYRFLNMDLLSFLVRLIGLALASRLNS
jgi:hypothetical protein